MSTLMRCLGFGLALCVMLAAAPLPAAHHPKGSGFSSDTASYNAQKAPTNHKSQRPNCALTGNCGGRHTKSTCRKNGFCIPASHAWSPDGPLATKSRKPGGFPALDTKPPLPVPLPLPGFLLASALLFIRLLARRKSSQATN